MIKLLLIGDMEPFVCKTGCSTAAMAPLPRLGTVAEKTQLVICLSQMGIGRKGL